MYTNCYECDRSPLGDLAVGARSSLTAALYRSALVHLTNIARGKSTKTSLSMLTFSHKADGIYLTTGLRFGHFGEAAELQAIRQCEEGVWRWWSKASSQFDFNCASIPPSD